MVSQFLDFSCSCFLLLKGTISLAIGYYMKFLKDFKAASALTKEFPNIVSTHVKGVPTVYGVNNFSQIS
jgi:hypothetical protein